MKKIINVILSTCIAVSCLVATVYANPTTSNTAVEPSHGLGSIIATQRTGGTYDIGSGQAMGVDANIPPNTAGYSENFINLTNGWCDFVRSSGGPVTLQFIENTHGQVVSTCTYTPGGNNIQLSGFDPAQSYRIVLTSSSAGFSADTGSTLHK